jgi:hypothetical protein
MKTINDIARDFRVTKSIALLESERYVRIEFDSEETRDAFLDATYDVVDYDVLSDGVDAVIVQKA